MKRPKLSYANVASTLALVMAATGGGIAYAQATAPKNSVTSRSIVNGTIQVKDINKKARPAVVEGAITNGTLSSSTAPLSTVSFTAPGKGYVLVTGHADFDAHSENTYIGAYLYEGSDEIAFSWWDPGNTDAGDEWYDQSQDIFAVHPVTKGQHTYSLQAYEYGAANNALWADSQVIVQFFPTGRALAEARTVARAQK